MGEKVREVGREKEKQNGVKRNEDVKCVRR